MNKEKKHTQYCTLLLKIVQKINPNEGKMSCTEMSSVILFKRGKQLNTSK